MKIIRTLLIAVLALVGIFLLATAFIPKDVHVERSIQVEARPEQIYPYVSTFEKRGEWYPWYKRDPNMTRSLEGTDGVVGAVSRWEGDPNTVGSGQQTLVKLIENQRVETDLVFSTPMESEASSFVVLEEEDDGRTLITWGLDTRFPYPTNAMLVFMDMDETIGKDYEEGLTNLKKVVEDHVKDYGGYVIKNVDMSERHFIAIRQTVAFSQMQGFNENSMMQLSKFLASNNLLMDGMPCGLYYNWDEEDKQTDMAAALPVSNPPPSLSNPFTLITLPASRYLVIDYYGDYEGIGDAHDTLGKYIEDNNLNSAPPVYEEYLTDATKETDPSKWLTRIYYPLSS